MLETLGPLPAQIVDQVFEFARRLVRLLDHAGDARELIRDVGDFLRRILAEFLADRRAAIAAGFPASGRSLRFEQGAPARPVEQLARLAINFEIFELDAKVRDRCSGGVELLIGETAHTAEIFQPLDCR